MATYLAKFRQGYGLVSIDVTKTLSWFKKQHQYDWKKIKQAFSEQQQHHKFMASYVSEGSEKKKEERIVCAWKELKKKKRRRCLSS